MKSYYMISDMIVRRLFVVIVIVIVIVVSAFIPIINLVWSENPWLYLSSAYIFHRQHIISIEPFIRSVVLIHYGDESLWSGSLCIIHSFPHFNNNKLMFWVNKIIKINIKKPFPFAHVPDFILKFSL